MKTTASNNNGLSIFKHTAETNSSNDFKYLKSKIFNRDVSIKKIKSNLKFIALKLKFKTQQETALKKIHEYRLHDLKRTDKMIEHILAKIEGEPCENGDSNFAISTSEDISKKLYNLNTNYSEVKKIIDDEFGINNKNIKFIINDQNMKKILAEDFFSKIKQCIAKADTPKAIRFLYVFMIDLRTKDILSKDKIDSLSKHLDNKTQQLIESSIEKKFHEYRLSNLKSTDNTIEKLLTRIENEIECINSNSQFVISGSEYIAESLYDMNNKYSEVEKKIKDKFCINNENMKLIINDQNIKKILEEDFFSKIKQFIAKADTPKSIRFLYVLMSDSRTKDILSKNKIDSLSKHLHNKTQQLTESLIEKKIDFANKGDELLSEIHALTVICEQAEVSLSEIQRKKLVALCITCFDGYANIVPNQENNLNITDRLDGLKKLKKTIVDPIIKILSDSKNISENKNKVATKLEQTTAYVQAIIDNGKDRVTLLSEIAFSAEQTFDSALITIDKIATIHNKLQQEKKEFSIQQRPNPVKEIFHNIKMEKKIKKLQKSYNNAVEKLYAQCESFVKLNERHVEIKQYLVDHSEKFSSITPEVDKNKSMPDSKQSIIEHSIIESLEDIVYCYGADYLNVVDNKIIDLTTQQNKFVALLIINYGLKYSSGKLPVYKQKIDNILRIIDFKKIQDKLFIDDKRLF